MRTPAPSRKPSSSTPSRSGTWGAGAGPWLLLTALALVAYAPSLTGQFLWDDDAHVTRPELRSVAGLGRIWFDPGATQQYYPLLHSAFWIEHRIWGDAVLGYHLASVLLHAASAVLLLVILRRLTVNGALLAAAIFVVHPLQVESVAWISELKNTLSLALCLGSLLVYLEFDGDRRAWRYAIATALFVCGLLTKTVVATLPGVLLVLFWWQRGALSLRRDVVPLVPWFVLGIAAALVTARVERSMLGAQGAAFDWTVAERCVLAGRAAWFYLGKLLWPSPLLFVYPRWTLSAEWPWLFVPLSVVGVLAACVAVRHRWRGPLAVTLTYLGTLFPALGFVNVYPFVFSFVADHFAYLPAIPVIVAGSVLLWRLSLQASSRVQRALGTVIVALLAVLTWKQCAVYADAETLYLATLRENPACFLCLNNLGTIAVSRGDADRAIEQFDAALRVQPQSPETENNLANLLLQRGEATQAIEHYRRSLAIAPRNVIARTNLGIALVRVGRLRDARVEFEAALRVMPDYAPAAHNLDVLKQAGVVN